MLAFAAVGLVLVWQVLTRSFAAYLATVAPETALVLRSTEALGHVTIADEMLKPSSESDVAAKTASTMGRPRVETPPAGPGERLSGLSQIASKVASADSQGPAQNSATSTPPERLPISKMDEIRSHALAALLNEPYNPRAFRILGQLAAISGDQADATKFMRAASDRSRGDLIAVSWMVQSSFDNKDYASAAYYADIFLRKRPSQIEYVLPVLAKMAAGPDEAAAEVKKLLVANPPWRTYFFTYLPQKTTDSRLPLDLLLSIKDTANPPSTETINRYLRVLITRGQFDLAYYTWLQFLSVDELAGVGFVQNGSFEKQPTGSPFDWQLNQGAGISIDIVRRPDMPDQHALFLEFGPGRVDFPGVAQTLFLAPGRYRFQGSVKGELVGQRGMHWRVLCSGGGAVRSIGEGDMFIGLADLWQKIEIGFSVPEKDCRAQELRLDLAARSPSEQLVSGSLWYDELKIERLEDPTADAVASANGPAQATEPASRTDAPPGNMPATMAADPTAIKVETPNATGAILPAPAPRRGKKAGEAPRPKSGSDLPAPGGGGKKSKPGDAPPKGDVKSYQSGSWAPIEVSRPKVEAPSPLR